MGDERQIYLGKASWPGTVKIVHAVPDRLENPDIKG
jgi:hypothetical protein